PSFRLPWRDGAGGDGDLLSRLLQDHRARRVRHEALRCDGRLEGGVVSLVLIGVTGGEGDDGLLERVALSEVAGDAMALARLGVGPGEGPRAKLAVLEEADGGEGIHVDGRLHVPELAHVEVAPGRARRPSEKDVAGGLHQALTLHHPLAMVGVLALAD